MSKKTARNAFRSLRPQRSIPTLIQVEEFRDRDARNERWAALRAQGTKHVTRFSTHKGGERRITWCVAHP